jgi:hypothetical protein
MAGSRSIDHRADIYSLGVVFYELLTGEVPMGQFEPPSRCAETDVRLDEVVMRALAREPERRFQSVSEMKLRVDAFTSGNGQVHDLVAGSPERPRGMSSIVEREVAAAWRWVAGEPDPWTRKQELPALLMFVIAVAGSLMILLPWVDYRIDEPAESQQARAAVATTDAASHDAIPKFPIVHSVKGTAYPGAAVASVAFAAIGLLILATPRNMRRSVSWGLLLTVLAGIALVGVIAIQIDVNSQRFTIPMFKQGQWIQKTGTIDNTSHRIGFYAALGLAIAELVFGASGVRHAIALRSRTSADTDPQVAQPRFSRKAIVGAVLAAIFFVGMLLLVAPTMVVHQTVPGADRADSNTGGPAMFMVLYLLLLSLPVLLAAVGTTILGIVAVGEIRHSNGRLVGLGLAFLDAVLFPTLLLGSMVIAAACILSSPDERVVAGICSAALVGVVIIIVWIQLWRSVSRPLLSKQ